MMRELIEMKNKDFAVEIKKQINGVKIMRITHNGYQWNTISLYEKEEIEAVIETLKKELGND